LHVLLLALQPTFFPRFNIFVSLNGNEQHYEPSVGWVYVVLVIIKCGYLKIKKFKKSPWSNYFIFRDLKNSSGLSLRNAKRGGYEVGTRVRVCD
jgi:hypothetical protein